MRMRVIEHALACMNLFSVAAADVVVGQLLVVIILVEQVLQGLLLLVFAELKETSRSQRLLR